MNPLDRRSFLRVGGFAFAGLAAACSKKPLALDGKTPTIAKLLEGKKRNMVAVPAQQPNLVRQNDRLAVALLHLESSSTRTPYRGGRARAWVSTKPEDPAQGPIDLVYHDDGLGDKGIYIGRASFSHEGNWVMFVEALPEGATELLATGAPLKVEKPTQPSPGDKAISVPTPTVADHRGVEPYCTLKPSPCSMHQISLDVALKNGKPTVLLIGTPAFCQSQTCGPVTEVVQKVSATGLGARANFIHIEEFKDDKDAPAKQLLAPAAEAWKLESEPVVYYIKPDGTITEWSIGPTDVAEVTALTTTLVS